jgi:thioredoxin-like negative regulator of GroEL
LLAQARKAVGHKDEEMAALHRQVKLIESYQRENPGNPRAAILSAVALATVGDNPGAIHYLKTAIAADPGDTTNLHNAACTYAMIGRVPVALDGLEKAVGNA